jgi:hypothetical protein
MRDQWRQYLKCDGVELLKGHDGLRGLYTTRAFKRGEVVCRLTGPLCKESSLSKEALKYAISLRIKSPFNIINPLHRDVKTMGHYINSSLKRGKPNVMFFENDTRHPTHVVIIAKRDIVKGEELLAYYGAARTRLLRTEINERSKTQTKSFVNGQLDCQMPATKKQKAVDATTDWTQSIVPADYNSDSDSDYAPSESDVSVSSQSSASSDSSDESDLLSQSSASSDRSDESYLSE